MMNVFFLFAQKMVADRIERVRSKFVIPQQNLVQVKRLLFFFEKDVGAAEATY